MEDDYAIIPAALHGRVSNMMRYVLFPREMGLKDFTEGAHVPGTTLDYRWRATSGNPRLSATRAESRYVSSVLSDRCFAMIRRISRGAPCCSR